MKEIYYFIEDATTKKWHYIDKRPDDRNPCAFVGDVKIFLYNEWTDFPLAAIRFYSEEEAEGYLKHSFELREMENIVITAHQFEVTPYKKSS